MIKTVSKLEVEKSFLNMLQRNIDNFFVVSGIGTKILLDHILLKVLPAAK